MPDTSAARDTLQVLAAIPSFAGVEAETLAALARAASRRSYEPGEIVFLEGEPCGGLYVVESGWLKSSKIAASGREQVMRFVGPGETFNEIGVLAGAHNLVTVTALEAAVVWLLRRTTVVEWLQRDPRLALRITENLAQRVLHLIALVEDLSLRSVEERLAQLLLQHAVDGTVHRRRWATQAEMAARIGTVPEVLGRALRELAEEGLIRVERQQIQILDAAGLKAKALSGSG